MRRAKPETEQLLTDLWPSAGTQISQKLRVFGIHWPELFIQKNDISGEKSGVLDFLAISEAF